MLFPVNRENEIHEQVTALHMSVDVLAKSDVSNNAITSKQSYSLHTVRHNDHVNQ